MKFFPTLFRRIDDNPEDLYLLPNESYIKYKEAPFYVAYSLCKDKCFDNGSQACQIKLQSPETCSGCVSIASLDKGRIERSWPAEMLFSYPRTYIKVKGAQQSPGGWVPLPQMVEALKKGDVWV